MQFSECIAEWQNHRTEIGPTSGADRPGGMSGVSRCALCTNVAPAPRASNKKQLSFYHVISKLNNEKLQVLQKPCELRLKQYAIKKAPCPANVRRPHFSNFPVTLIQLIRLCPTCFFQLTVLNSFIFLMKILQKFIHCLQEFLHSC